MALMNMVLAGKKTVNHQKDDYELCSTVESVAVLVADSLWSGYLGDPAQNGQAGTIASFRTYMTTIGIPNSGPGGPPTAAQGVDLLPMISIPDDGAGQSRLNHVNVDSARVVRRDLADSCQLYVTISASTSRGKGIVNPVLNRAVQQVFTVEPELFAGFDYALLTNNVNCIFCHTNVDSVERWFNNDSSNYGSYDRVKVGSLETLMLRHDQDGKSWIVNHYDADSFVAGTVYSRGVITDHDGVRISNWAAQSFKGYGFDGVTGCIIEDQWGTPQVVDFVPAGTPPQPLENLYENYPLVYADMPDGELPLSFPPPIPDDGGVDPLTGLPDPAAIGNRRVDDSEFHAISDTALGSITAGVMTLLPAGATISTTQQYSQALFVGNQSSLQHSITGNVILSGTVDNPITIDGTLAIDGDLIINGYIKGEGNLVVRGNVYIPTDLQYLDGQEYVAGDPPGQPSGPRTFGIAQDGTKNVLGLAAGGNVMIGDYLKPSALQPDGSWVMPGQFDFISGDSGGEWSFSLSEMSLFNRSEWMKTQPMLPGSPGEADLPPAQWTAVNPQYDPNHVPRYYAHGPGDEIPIYNRGNVYFDTATETWRGDIEVPFFWDASKLSYADPTDPSDPYLFDAGGNAIAVPYTVTPKDGWISDDMYKIGTWYFENNRPGGPMKLDGLFYTNNAIFTLVSVTLPTTRGRVIINGALVASDIGMLAPGFANGQGNVSPLSGYAIGLQLNYDARVKRLLNVKNPWQVTLKRTLWNPTRNVL
jgi:hypothetical protein